MQRHRLRDGAAHLRVPVQAVLRHRALERDAVQSVERAGHLACALRMVEAFVGVEHDREVRGHLAHGRHALRDRVAEGALHLHAPEAQVETGLRPRGGVRRRPAAHPEIHGNAVDPLAAKQVMDRHAKVPAEQVQPRHLVRFVDDVGLVVVGVGQRQVADRQVDELLADQQVGLLAQRNVQVAPARFTQPDEAVVGLQLDDPLGELPEIQRPPGHRVGRAQLVVHPFRVHDAGPHRHDHLVYPHVDDLHRFSLQLQGASSPRASRCRRSHPFLRIGSSAPSGISG